jgi:hypothetical protein
MEGFMRRLKQISGVGVSVLAATALAFGSIPDAVASTGAAVSAGGPSQPVIVVLTDQHQNLPDTPALRAARASAVTASQDPVITALHASGAKNIHSMNVLNAVAATVSTQEQAALRADPGVAEVVPDAAIKVVGRPAPPVPTVAADGASAGSQAPRGRSVRPGRA